jgi:uncharacterized membrane protein
VQIRDAPESRALTLRLAGTLCLLIKQTMSAVPVRLLVSLYYTVIPGFF